MRKSGIYLMHLSYPPISNQEGDWLYNDPNVRDILKRSKLYFIGQREELLFEDVAHPNGPDGVWVFNLKCGAQICGPLALDFGQLDLPDSIQVELGPKCLKIRALPLHADQEPVYWCTPDILLYQHSHGVVHVTGLADTKPLSTFKLHYVGISKKGDSFSRLFDGHVNRSKILSNEGQIKTEARLTDEVMLFMFHIDDISIQTDIGISDIDEAFGGGVDSIEQMTMVADAEKAFANIMKTHYNRESYDSYPKSKDGLWGRGLDSYAFAINEQLIFQTNTCQIAGGELFSEAEPDLIHVSGELVSLISTPRRSDPPKEH
ncbi:hypothetical protein OJ996_05390 [Luteolibacter sp. GHJ8]|uniref:Uncharacterized protein n=1 Tax=Luteolibacter rhizosphaerae TaxID=2989719 RepID=A0ABT3FZJ7_9BACT|nr:hypothetical protein [Luteolibacter rhizosphaerae]MCW1912993.1 hypothetical protein [Luteolibacter rhizosphaerae]